MPDNGSAGRKSRRIKIDDESSHEGSLSLTKKSQRDAWNEIEDEAVEDGRRGP